MMAELLVLVMLTTLDPAKGPIGASVTYPSESSRYAARKKSRPAKRRGRVKSRVKKRLSNEELLDQAQEHFQRLEYDRVIPVIATLLKRDGLSTDTRLDAYFLQGSALAIIGDPVSAEGPFRFLLRGRPEFTPPEGTSPKILGVFRKVESEERAIRAEIERVELERLIATLEISGGPSEDSRGGLPLPFRYQIRDPRGALSRVEVRYRRRGEPAYSSLALQKDDSGFWIGSLPGEWTENDLGLELEYFVSSRSGDNIPLLQLGSEVDPLAVSLEPGQIDRGTPFYRTIWFWTAVGIAVVAGGIATFIAVDDARSLPSGDLRFEF